MAAFGNMRKIFCLKYPTAKAVQKFLPLLHPVLLNKNLPTLDQSDPNLIKSKQTENNADFWKKKNHHYIAVMHFHSNSILVNKRKQFVYDLENGSYLCSALCCNVKLPYSIRQCVNLLNRKANPRSGITEQTENMTNFLPLNRFLAKTPRVNKIALESFSKHCRPESTLNCRSHHIT